MRKILFVLVAALAFVACEKDIPQATQFVGITPEKVVLEKATGGSITIETSHDSFVDAIGTYIKVNANGYDGYEIANTKSFFKIYPPLYLIKFDDIIKYKEYEGLGCKVVPDGFQKFNIHFFRLSGVQNPFFTRTLQLIIIYNRGFVNKKRTKIVRFK